MKARHAAATAKRRDAVIDIAAFVILIFALNLLVWGGLAESGIVAVWVVAVLMLVRVAGFVIYRRYRLRRDAR